MAASATAGRSLGPSSASQLLGLIVPQLQVLGPNSTPWLPGLKVPPTVGLPAPPVHGAQGGFEPSWLAGIQAAGGDPATHKN